MTDRDMERQANETSEARFRNAFSHLGAITAYARRRGSLDADALAAEVMTIAWRRLADVPRDDPRPWLYATARNLLMAETRRSATARLHTAEAPAPEPAPGSSSSTRSSPRPSASSRRSTARHCS